MQPWRCDPYLWVHLAGLATVPLWIDLGLLGLAVGTPTLPGLELAVIIVLGVLPVLVMQLWQPFYIFSLPGLALRPTALQDDQRRLLTQFRRWRVRLGALLVPLPLVWLLVKLYPLAFLAREITPFGDWGRLGGVAIAALSFFFANLFLQVPVAVLQVLATPDCRMQTVVPYSVDAIPADFTWFGMTIGKILPTLALAEAKVPGSENVSAFSENPPEGFPEHARHTETSSEPLVNEVVEHLHLAEAAAAPAAAETPEKQVTVVVVPAAEHVAVDEPPRGEAAAGESSMAALPPVPVEALEVEEKGFLVLDTMTRQQ